MARVVFLDDYRRDSRRTESPPGSGATIHLFLGVRYERYEDAVPQAPVRKGGGGRRPRKRA